MYMLIAVQQLQSLLDDVRRETEALRTQLNNERATKQGLEGLLHDNHTKGWQTQMSIQEKDTEIQLLKDRLALNESKMYLLHAVFRKISNSVKIFVCLNCGAFCLMFFKYVSLIWVIG